MTQMTVAEIAKQARANSERWFPLTHDPSRQPVPLYVHYTLGLVGEAGEVANLIKKSLRKMDDVTHDQLGEELADVFIYLLLLADEVDVDLVEAYQRKTRINESRWGRNS